MRALAVVLFVLVLVVGDAAVGNAGSKTDKDKFDAAVSKFAPTFQQIFGTGVPFKPKGLCVCTNTADANKAGFLQRDGNGLVFCEWPIFLPDGSFAQAAVPCPQFEVLSK